MRKCIWRRLRTSRRYLHLSITWLRLPPTTNNYFTTKVDTSFFSFTRTEPSVSLSHRVLRHLWPTCNTNFIGLQYSDYLIAVLQSIAGILSVVCLLITQSLEKWMKEHSFHSYQTNNIFPKSHSLSSVGKTPWDIVPPALCRGAQTPALYNAANGTGYR